MAGTGSGNKVGSNINSDPSALLIYQIRKVQQYSSSIVGVITENNVSLSNITQEQIGELPVVSLNTLVNTQLTLSGVQVVPQGTTIPIELTGLLSYMQQAIGQAYATNSSNNSILYPFNSQNLYGLEVDLVMLTKNLASFAGKDLGPTFIYNLIFTTISNSLDDE